MSDVALVAGVSHQTVSRVLNTPDAVRETTRERVTQAMAELGYRPNLAARALARARSPLLGVISAGEARFGPTHALHAVEEAAQAAGYISTHVPAISPTQAREATDHLFSVGVAGIVVVAPTHELADRIVARRRDTPVVLIAAGAPISEGVSVVAVDQELGARLAVRHLAELGHTRIHHLSGPPRWFDAHTRVIGWQEECHALGLEQGLLVEGGWDAADGFAATNRLLAAGASVEAIFAANDLMALGAIRALRMRGLDVPGDVSVVGFDDAEGTDFYLPPLTTVRQPFAHVGRLAIEVLLTMLDGESATSRSPEPELVVRESAASPRR
ncbi:MAG TPA: substrate-binding domain-containing protein [Actinomycetales bacterium]|nr:substrate-binding domain-containing protein [Actinomycetales bacterium]